MNRTSFANQFANVTLVGKRTATRLFVVRHKSSYLSGYLVKKNGDSKDTPPTVLQVSTAQIKKIVPFTPEKTMLSYTGFSKTKTVTEVEEAQ